MKDANRFDRLCAWCTDPKVPEDEYMLGQRFCSDSCRDQFITEGIADVKNQPRFQGPIAGPCTVWVDYGCEGWKPHDFTTAQEARDYILGGTSSPIRVTQDAMLVLLSRKEA